MEAPIVMPLEELTACQQLVSTWIDAHFTLLLVVGILGLLGGFGGLNYVLRVSVGLGKWGIARWRGVAAQGKE